MKQLQKAKETYVIAKAAYETFYPLYLEQLEEVEDRIEEYEEGMTQEELDAVDAELLEIAERWNIDKYATDLKNAENELLAESIRVVNEAPVPQAMKDRAINTIKLASKSAVYREKALELAMQLHSR